jgi:hypothetical protein
MDYLEPMKAAVLFGFNDVRMTERPIPSPGVDATGKNKGERPNHPHLSFGSNQ